MEQLAQLRRAHEHFQRAVGAVTPQHLDRPTSCAEWDVAALLRHVIGGDLAYVELLHGADVGTFRDVLDGLVLDVADLSGQSLSSAERALAAFGEPGALQRTVHHPMGELPATDLARMRAVEWAVHGWDLARAVGADDRLDDELAAALYEQMAPRAAILPTTGYFRAGAGVPADAPAQSRLLDLLGRQP